MAGGHLGFSFEDLNKPSKGVLEELVVDVPTHVYEKLGLFEDKEIKTLHYRVFFFEFKVISFHYFNTILFSNDNFIC